MEKPAHLLRNPIIIWFCLSSLAVRFLLLKEQHSYTMIFHKQRVARIMMVQLCEDCDAALATRTPMANGYCTEAFSLQAIAETIKSRNLSSGSPLYNR